MTGRLEDFAGRAGHLSIENHEVVDMKSARFLLGWMMLQGFAGAEVLTAPPAAPDPAARHIIYLHGAIVTGTDGRPISERFGAYEYRAILKRLGAAGATVISEIRQDDSDDVANIGRVVSWITDLKRRGVPAKHISVIGASLGGIIAAKVAHTLADPEIHYVLVASTYRMESMSPFELHGRVLVIHDEADNRDWIEHDYFRRSPDLADSKIVVTRTGLGHGLIYTAHDAWLIPTLAWTAAD